MDLGVTKEEKREFLAYYNKYGPRATELKYGLHRYAASAIRTRYMKNLKELRYMRVSDFVESATDEQIEEFIKYSNEFGYSAASDKYHIKNLNYNSKTAQLLIDRGLIIHRKAHHRETIYMKVCRMRKEGCDFDKIHKVLSATYNSSIIRTNMKRWCYEHDASDVDDRLLASHDTHRIDVEELRKYAKTHTCVQSAIHFECNVQKIYVISSRNHIKHVIPEHDTFVQLYNRLKITPYSTKHYIQTHTIPQSAKRFGVSYGMIYRLCKKHNWEFKKVR